MSKLETKHNPEIKQIIHVDPPRGSTLKCFHNDSAYKTTTLIALILSKILEKKNGGFLIRFR